MLNTRRLPGTLLLCALLTVSACFAQTTLTQVRDTVVNPDGTSFSGTLVITWNGFTGSSSGSAAPLSTSAHIYNGALSVLLVPTTTASPGTFYQVIYYSNNGVPAWTETWQVPPSTTPLALSAVRTSTTEGSSGSGGSTGTGGTGSSGSTGTGTGNGQYATLPIALNQITGLSADLASINAAIASLTTQLTGIGVVGAGTSASFIDAETPAGTLDGSNGTFLLSHTPSPAASVAVYRNGLLQTVGVDYTLSGSTVSFLPVGIPKSTDVVNAFYRIAGTGPTASFADSESPGGTIDGNNLTFTLANAPTPSLSLELFKNGILLTQNSDYTLSGKTIVFSAAVTPQPGDILTASYRH